MKEAILVTEREKLDTPEKVTEWLHAARSYPKKAILEYYEAFGPEAWWQLRERERFITDKRKAPAWLSTNHQDKLHEYFIYAASEDPMKIAFTPDEKYGREDRRVVTTVGRFLGKYFSDIWTEAQIKAIADEHRAEFGPPVLHFVFDADSIEEVYTKGVSSCMSHRELGVKHEHPVRVYDGPDTGLACILAGGRATARAVIRVDTKPMKYSRIYGDPVIKKRLDALGFVEGPLNDVRLRVATHENWLLMPYIDSCPNIQYNRGDDFAVATAKGNLSCKVAQGVIELPAEPNYACDCCGKRGTKQKMLRVRTAANPEQYVCPNHRGTEYVGAVFDNRYNEAYVPVTETIVIDNTTYHNTEAVRNMLDLVLCRHDNTWRKRADVTFVPSKQSYYVKRSVCVPRGHTVAFTKTQCVPVEGGWLLKPEHERIAA